MKTQLLLAKCINYIINESAEADSEYSKPGAIVDLFADYPDDEDKWLAVASHLDQSDPDAAEIIRAKVADKRAKSAIDNYSGPVSKDHPLAIDRREKRDNFIKLIRKYELKALEQNKKRIGLEKFKGTNVNYLMNSNGLPTFASINMHDHGVVKDLKAVLTRQTGRFIHALTITEEQKGFSDTSKEEFDELFSIPEVLTNIIVLEIRNTSTGTARNLIESLLENVGRFRNLLSVEFSTANVEEEDVLRLVEKLPQSARKLSIIEHNVSPEFVKKVIELKLDDATSLKSLVIFDRSMDKYYYETLKLAAHDAGLEIKSATDDHDFYN